MTDDLLACRRCGSTKLELVEVTEEVHTWDPGLRVVDGVLHPTGVADHAPGNILTAKSRIKCLGCRRSWHPRRRIGDPIDQAQP